MKLTWDKILLFAFSIALISSLIAISLLHESMSEQQWFVCIWALAFGGAGFAAFLPGSIEWEVTPRLKAGGALAVLLLVFWFGRGIKSVHGDIKQWKLEAPPVETEVGPDVMKATVYVYVNGRMQAEDDKGILVDHGPGGLEVTINAEETGRKLTFVVKDEDKWWISEDVIVPPAFSVKLVSADEKTVKDRTQP